MVQLNQNPDAFPSFLSILHDQWKLSQPIGVFGTFKNVYLERILDAMSSEIAKVAVFFFHWRVRCACIIINIILVSTMDRWVSGVTNHLAVNMSPSIDGYWRELFLFFVCIYSCLIMYVNDLYSLLYSIGGYALYVSNEIVTMNVKIEEK